MPGPDAPAEGREPVSLGCDDRAPGVGERALDHRLRASADDLHLPDEPVEKGGDRRIRGTHRLPQRLGPRGDGRRWPGRRPAWQQRQDAAAGTRRPQSLDSGTGRGAALDEDRVEHPLDRRFEGEHQVVVDLDDVEQRSDHARDGGEPFHPRPRAGLVEGELERLGPGRAPPGVAP